MRRCTCSPNKGQNIEREVYIFCWIYWRNAVCCQFAAHVLDLIFLCILAKMLNLGRGKCAAKLGPTRCQLGSDGCQLGGILGELGPRTVSILQQQNQEHALLAILAGVLGGRWPHQSWRGDGRQFFFIQPATFLIGRKLGASTFGSSPLRALLATFFLKKSAGHFPYRA